jgi:Fe-S-cluster-containing hydrogenase component 2
VRAGKRKIIEIDEELCDGCGLCVPSCAEGAIQVVAGKARLVADKYCDGLGACLGECPTGALQIVEREADEFDEAAVEAYLRDKENEPRGDKIQPPMCPSNRVQTFIPRAGAAADEGDPAHASSRLTHWPVQIRLVPPNAPFLKGADLLVAADCTAFSYANFHGDFISEKVVMVGCPKFDDVDAYVKKFAEIFRTADIQSVTLVIMEVPCCSGLPTIVKRAMGQAGVEIPTKEIILSTRGEVLQKVA